MHIHTFRTDNKQNCIRCLHIYSWAVSFYQIRFDSLFAFTFFFCCCCRPCPHFRRGFFSSFYLYVSVRAFFFFALFTSVQFPFHLIEKLNNGNSFLFSLAAVFILFFPHCVLRLFFFLMISLCFAFCSTNPPTPMPPSIGSTSKILHQLQLHSIYEEKQ